MVWKESCANVLCICECKLATFLHNIMNVSCHHQRTLNILLTFLLLFFLVFFSCFSLDQICRSRFNIHDTASISIVSKTNHDATWWDSWEKSGVKELRQPQVIFKLLLLDSFAESFTFNILKGHFLEDLVSFSHKVPDTSFFTVTFNHGVCSFMREINFFLYIFRNTSTMDAIFDNVSLENLFFFVSGVPSDFNPFKPVQQRWKNGFKTVGSANEQYVWQVDF